MSLRLASRTASSEYAGDGHVGSTVALGAANPSFETRAFAARTAALTAGAIANVDCPPFCVATATTDTDGRYTFTGHFPADTYHIVADQLVGYLDGKETAGTLGGTVDNSQDSNTIGNIVVHAGDAGTDYNFADLRPSRLQGLVWEDDNNNGEVPDP